MVVQDQVEGALKRLGRNEPLTNDVYWANLLMLLIVTWTVLLYLLRPVIGGQEVPVYIILIMLYMAAYGLIQFNEAEVLREKLNRIEEKME